MTGTCRPTTEFKFRFLADCLFWIFYSLQLDRIITGTTVMCASMPNVSLGVAWDRAFLTFQRSSFFDNIVIWYCQAHGGNSII